MKTVKQAYINHRKQRLKPRVVNALHDYCANDDEDAGVTLYHSDVYYTRAWLRDCTDFVERFGYLPSLGDVESAMIAEFGSQHTASAEDADLSPGDVEDLWTEIEEMKT